MDGIGTPAKESRVVLIRRELRPVGGQARSLGHLEAGRGEQQQPRNQGVEDKQYEGTYGTREFQEISHPLHRLPGVMLNEPGKERKKKRKKEKRTRGAQPGCVGTGPRSLQSTSMPRQLINDPWQGPVSLHFAQAFHIAFLKPATTAPSLSLLGRTGIMDE
jgi:hypothetical protein